jgi:Ca2+-transporting ATPase
VVTLIFIILGVKSLLSIFSLRSFSQPIWRYHPFSNRYLIGAVAASLFLLVISVYWPPLQMILHTVSLGPVDWLIAFGFGLFNILLIEGVKLTSAYARQK